MHDILLYAVSLWGIAESRTEIIPSNQMCSPLVLTSVSRQWSRFITASSQLWSYLLLDTDDEGVLEHLQLFLVLSRNQRLFIVLRGRTVLCDAIVIELLRVGDRIDALVYPPDVPHSTLANFGFHLGAAHQQLDPICPWYVLSVMQSWHRMYHYSFPTSIRSLWMDGLFLLSDLMTLLHFQALSSLSVKISLDRGLSLGLESRLELPNLERLRLQVALMSDQGVEEPVVMICQNLKFLHIQYALELDLEDPREDPAPWLTFNGVDGLQELQIHLEIHVVTNGSSIHPLAERLQRERLQREQLQRGQLQQQLQQQPQPQTAERPADEYVQQLEQYVQRVEKEVWRSEQKLQKEVRRVFWQVQRALLDKGRREEEQRRREEEQRRQEEEQRRQEEEQRLREAEERRQQEEEQRRRQDEERQQQQAEEQLLRSMASMRERWRRWLSLPDHLDTVRQSSLEMTPSTHEDVYGFISNAVEETLLLELPRLTELTTSNVPRILPGHLQKLHLHGFSMPDPLTPISLPSLVSLEINADTLDHLLIMRYIQVPQLRILRVQVQDGPGELHECDWRDTTSNLLDHIFLRIEIPRHKRADRLLVFRLPPTDTLNISSPYKPLCLFLAEPVPLRYTLRAEIDINQSAVWQEFLMTEWINPHHGIPHLAKFRTLVSLQRITLDQNLYLLSKPSPTDELFKLLAESIFICPQLTSITVAQCPSSWPNFLCQLRKRNRNAMLSGSTKCIEELSFYQPLHATITRWLEDAIKGKILNVTEGPPIREGNAWPMRPFEEDGGVFRSCYTCHITGMELGCLESETRSVDCGHDRGGGSRIEAV